MRSGDRVSSEVELDFPSDLEKEGFELGLVERLLEADPGGAKGKGRGATR